MLSGWRWSGCSVLLGVLFVAAAFSQDSGVARQFDPTITLDVDAGRFRYDVYFGREKSEQLEGGDTKIGAGVSFRVKPLFKHFIDALDTDKKHVMTVRLGYEYLQANENREHSGTHTARVDGTLRWAFPKSILMADRNRVELRWVDSDPSFRYRNRLQLERPFKLFKRKFTPYGSAEAYWDSRFRTWNKFRYTFGTDIPLIWKTGLDLYYTRERCVTCADPHTDILGANVTIYFKLKK